MGNFETPYENQSMVEVLPDRSLISFGILWYYMGFQNRGPMESNETNLGIIVIIIIIIIIIIKNYNNDT